MISYFPSTKLKKKKKVSLARRTITGSSCHSLLLFIPLAISKLTNAFLSPQPPTGSVSSLQKRSAKVVGTVGNPRKFGFLRSHLPDPNASFILRDPASNFEARAREALASLLSNEGENEGALKAQSST